VVNGTSYSATDLFFCVIKALSESCCNLRSLWRSIHKVVNFPSDRIIPPSN
jgi:hypothetical protein